MESKVNQLLRLGIANNLTFSLSSGAHSILGLVDEFIHATSQSKQHEKVAIVIAADLYQASIAKSLYLSYSLVEIKTFIVNPDFIRSYEEVVSKSIEGYYMVHRCPNFSIIVRSI